MDIRKIRKIINLMKETGVSEIEIKEGEEAVRVSQSSNNHQEARNPIVDVSAKVSSEQSAVTSIEEEGKTVDGHKVNSPMVGIFYVSPSPDAKAFVEVGQFVKKGEVLCVVEAMKMFNQIEADCSGKIAACLVESGQPVEYGQPLFVIEQRG